MLVDYGDPAGLPDLREAIARHVSASRGYRCSADMVVVTAGTQEGLNLVSRMFIEEGTGVVIENPGYGSAAFTFESYGARLIPVGVDEYGVDTDLLPESTARLAYVTPSHQFPTGVSLAPERRQRLLEWSHRSGAYILEDDYDSDFNHSGPPLMSLAGADANESVIYLGTFSKALGAGVRTGFVIFPRHLIDAARAVKTMSNLGHPWLEQAVLAAFFRGETFQRHLRFIRKAYRDTLEHLTSQLVAEFGPVDLRGTQNGMHVMWRLPDWVGSAHPFAERLRTRGIHVYTLASGGAYDDASPYGDNCLLLGYAALGKSDVSVAVRVMADVADKNSSRAPSRRAAFTADPDARP